MFIIHMEGGYSIRIPLKRTESPSIAFLSYLKGKYTYRLKSLS